MMLFMFVVLIEHQRDGLCSSHASTFSDQLITQAWAERGWKWWRSGQRDKGSKPSLASSAQCSSASPHPPTAFIQPLPKTVFQRAEKVGHEVWRVSQREKRTEGGYISVWRRWSRGGDYQESLPTGETSRLDFAASVTPQRRKHTLMLKLK